MVWSPIKREQERSHICSKCSYTLIKTMGCRQHLSTLFIQWDKIFSISLWIESAVTAYTHIIYFVLYFNFDTLLWPVTCCSAYWNISAEPLTLFISASLPPPLLTPVHKASSQSLMMWKIHHNTQNNPLVNEQSAYFGPIILCHVATLSSGTLTSMTQSPAVHCLCGCSVRVPVEIWYC